MTYIYLIYTTEQLSVKSPTMAVLGFELTTLQTEAQSLNHWASPVCAANTDLTHAELFILITSVRLETTAAVDMVNAGKSYIQ